MKDYVTPEVVELTDVSHLSTAESHDWYSAVY